MAEDELREAAQKQANGAPEETSEQLADNQPVNEEFEGLKTQLEAKDKQVQELSERVKRLQADFDNYRRRTRQEKEELSAVVAQGLIKDLLPLLDNFERALTAPNCQENTSGFKDGVEMIFKQFIHALEKNGLEKINAVGEAFDPNYHEAIMRVADETKPDDTVAEELQCGYTVQGKVIRPSMVKVVGN